jgi:uncharacterized protein (TIRG00374 family)
MKKKILMMRADSRVSYLLKLAFSILLLGGVFLSIDFGRVWLTLNQLPWWYFTLAVLFQLLVLLMIAVRWWVLSPNAKLTKLLHITFGSQHLMFLVPSSVTVDVVRVWSVRSEPSGTAGDFGAIVYDKVSGIVAIMMSFGISVLFAPLPANIYSYFHLPALCSLTGSLMIVVLLFSNASTLVHGYFSGSRIGKALVEKMPASVVKLLSSALVSGASISRLRLFVNLGCALMYQLLAILGFWLMALALNFHLSAGQMLFLSTLMQIVMLFPVSIAGIGLKDVSLVYALGLFGVESSVAFSASISGYPVSVAFALLGWMLSSTIVRKSKNSMEYTHDR